MKTIFLLLGLIMGIGLTEASSSSSSRPTEGQVKLQDNQVPKIYDKSGKEVPVIYDEVKGKYKITLGGITIYATPDALNKIRSTQFFGQTDLTETGFECMYGDTVCNDESIKKSVIFTRQLGLLKTWFEVRATNLSLLIPLLYVATIETEDPNGRSYLTRQAPYYKYKLRFSYTEQYINAIHPEPITLEGLSALLKTGSDSKKPVEWFKFRINSALEKLDGTVKAIREYCSDPQNLDPENKAAAGFIVTALDSIFGNPSDTGTLGGEGLFQEAIDYYSEDLHNLLDGKIRINELNTSIEQSIQFLRTNSARINNVILNGYLTEIIRLLEKFTSVYLSISRALFEAQGHGLNLNNSDAWKIPSEQAEFREFASSIEIILTDFKQFGEQIKVFSEELKFALQGRERPARN